MHFAATPFDRRRFLAGAGLSLGSLALAALGDPLAAPAAAEKRFGGLPGLPHFAPKAKRIIYLFMSEGPSQMDMFDYKPAMDALFNKDLPDSVRGNQRITGMTAGQGRLPIAPSKYKFTQHGKAGGHFSELVPWHAKMADDITFIQSMHTEHINHDPAITFACTGSQIPGRASMGSWLSYGLGTMNDNLPAYVVMTPSWTGRKEAQALFSRLWGAGFLPAEHQGCALRSKGDPVLYLQDPTGLSRDQRRAMLDTLGQLNHDSFGLVQDPEITARIAQYELAFRMQSSVPELVDIKSEPKHVLDLYGPEVLTPGSFANCAILARRLVERGTRVVQLFHRGWDQHFNVGTDLPNQCRDVDQACYGLVQDLKQRGLLEDTIVVWGGEFGRTIYSQGALTKDNYGRDHHPRCFTYWITGGGFKRGLRYGATDDFSYNITENPVSFPDLHATILHQMGIHHDQFTVKSQGLDIKLTGVEPCKMVKDLI